MRKEMILSDFLEVSLVSSHARSFFYASHVMLKLLKKKLALEHVINEV